jgi:hypothetical protein
VTRPPQPLERVTFATPRAAEFFDARALLARRLAELDDLARILAESGRQRPPEPMRSLSVLGRDRDADAPEHLEAGR